MKIIASSLVILSILILSSCRVNSWYKSKEKLTIFTIGSGSNDAMFYPVASSLCKIFNKYNEDKTVICRALLSSGAEYNLHAVENGEFDMGIAQANLQYDAYNGLNEFSGNPHKNLRTLLNVHDEYLTIISKNNEIKSFSDLRGKKINIGNNGSGSRILFSRMIDRFGWKLEDFAEIYEESGSNIKKVLCVKDKADAAIYIVGHPNKSFEFMINKCGATLISLSDSEIESFLPLSPKEFHKSFIPKHTYGAIHQNINTFASRTILSASTKLDKNIVRSFVKIISQHKEELLKLQPELFEISIPAEDYYPSLSPLHEALKK